MKITPRQRLTEFAHLLQGTLFGVIAESVGPLSAKAQLLVAVMTMVPVQPYLPSKGRWNGRPAKDRQALATAFMARAVYGLTQASELLDRLRNDRQLLRLCGWNHPSRVLKK